jgi:hypothetical protein
LNWNKGLIKAVVFICAVMSAFLLHSDWLYLEQEVWSQYLLHSDLTKQILTTLGADWDLVLVMVWMQWPLLLIFSCFCALACHPKHTRLFIYSLLGTSAFAFVVIPRLPVFKDLLVGVITPTVILSKQIIPLLLFLLVFFTTQTVHQKLAKSKA